MSLLGFDAIGRSALGALVRGAATNTIFRADVGSFALVGQPAAFRSLAASNSGTYAWSGNGAGFAMGLAAARGNYATLGGAVSFRPGMSTATGTFGLTGQPALATALFVSPGTNYSISGQAAPGAISIAVGLGSYGVLGSDASFGRGFEAWFPLPHDDNAWAARTDPDSDWNRPSAPADAWAPEPEPQLSWTLLSSQPSGWTAR
jgi:hypothetical protein